MEKLIEALQQWALENQEERGVLVLATDGKTGKSGGLLTGTTLAIAMAIALQAEKNPEIHRIFLLGLLASGKSTRFLSLRLRLVKWLLT